MPSFKHDRLLAGESFDAPTLPDWQRMTRTVCAAVASVLLGAGLCSAQAPDSATAVRSPAGREHSDALFHGHGFGGTGGVHIGTPAILSGALGIKHWLGDVVPGAVFVTAEPGILAFRYGGGYQIYDEHAYGAGAAIRFGRLTGWSNALGVTRGVQYSGGELAVLAGFAFALRVGAYTGRGANGLRRHLGTVDVGVGF
jgi:hypothetical protein